MASGKTSPQRSTNITFQAFSCRLAPESRSPREKENGVNGSNSHLSGGADDPGANLKGNLRGEITIKEEFIANPPLAGTKKKCPPPPLCGSYCTYPCPPCGPMAPEYEPTVLDGPYGTSSDPDNPCPPESSLHPPPSAQPVPSGLSPSPDSSVQADNRNGGDYHQVCVHPTDTCGSPTCYTCLGNLAQPRTDYIPLPQREEEDRRIHCHPMGADKNRKTWRWPCVRCRDIAGKPKPPTHQFIPCCVYKGRPEHFPEMTKECYRLLESIAGPESSRPILQEDLCTNPQQRRCRSNEPGSRCRGGSQSPERPAAGFNACYPAPPCNLLPARSETKTVHSVEACRSDPVLCGTYCDPYTVTEQQCTTNRTDFVEPPCNPCGYGGCYLSAAGNPPDNTGAMPRASAGGSECHHSPPPTESCRPPESRQEAEEDSSPNDVLTPTKEVDQEDQEYDNMQSDAIYSNQKMEQEEQEEPENQAMQHQEPNHLNSANQQQNMYGNQARSQQDMNYPNQTMQQQQDAMYSNQARLQDINYENQMRHQQQANYLNQIRQQQEAMYANQRRQQEAAYANQLRYQQEAMYANKMRQQQDASYANQVRSPVDGQSGSVDQTNIRQGNAMDSSYNPHCRQTESPDYAGSKKSISPSDIAYTMPSDKQVGGDNVPTGIQKLVPDSPGYQCRQSQPQQLQSQQFQSQQLQAQQLQAQQLQAQQLQAQQLQAQQFQAQKLQAQQLQAQQLQAQQLQAQQLQAQQLKPQQLQSQQPQYTYAPRQTQAFAPPQNYAGGSQTTEERRTPIIPTPVGSMQNTDHYKTNTPIVTPFTQRLTSPSGNCPTEQMKPPVPAKIYQPQSPNQFQQNQQHLQHQFQQNQYQQNQNPLLRRSDYTGSPQSFTKYAPDSGPCPVDNCHPSGDWNSSEEMRNKVAANRYEEPMRNATSIS